MSVEEVTTFIHLFHINRAGRTTLRFWRGGQNVETLRQIADIFERITENVKQPYDVRTTISRSHVRLSQGGPAKFERLS